MIDQDHITRRRNGVQVIDSAPPVAEVARPSRVLERLSRGLPSRQGVRGDFLLDPGTRAKPPLRPAAVLVPLVMRGDDMTVLLTQRTANLAAHAGQISFPGGRIEDSDPDEVAAALRETREEVGIDPCHIQVVGRLDTYETRTGFRVTPVVGVLSPGFEIVPDPGEVADVFEVPLSFILDRANRRRHSLMRNGRLRHWYAFPYEHRYIWGATAGMLVNLAQVLIEES